MTPVEIKRLVRNVVTSKKLDYDLVYKFLSRVVRVDEETDCWFLNEDWSVYRSYNKQPAHRYSYELFKGPLGKLLCCHHCDRPGCINPNHLFKGTHKDNQKDAWSKGRKIVVRPEFSRAVTEEERARDRIRQLVRFAGERE